MSLQAFEDQEGRGRYLVLCLHQLVLKLRAEFRPLCSMNPQAEVAVRVSLESRQILLTNTRRFDKWIRKLLHVVLIPREEVAQPSGKNRFGHTP